MKVRYSRGVFVRHVADESIIWCPKSGGCIVMKNVQPFLSEVGMAWREVAEIERTVANIYRIDVNEVHEDLAMVLDELQSQRFVEFIVAENEESIWGECSVEARLISARKEGAAQLPNQEYHSPIDDFCARHGIVAELHIDLTDACTERCVHCYVPKGQTDFLPVELAEKSLMEFRALNGLTVHLTGGEAMLHRDFERICRKCVELNLNLIIFSNMTLCDDKRIALLKDVAPQIVNVSVYSMKPEEHDAVTQLPGSWLRTIEAVSKCCAAGIPCRIATPLLKENYDALPALRVFADQLHMHLVPAVGIVAQADHCCANMAHACPIEKLRHVLARDYRLFHKSYEGVMPECDAKVCDIGIARLYLSAKGDYYPCDSMHGYVLGNVRDNTLKQVWRCEKLNYLRSLKNRDFGECAACAKRPWCKVCPAANFNATGDLLKHHPDTCIVTDVIQDVYGKVAAKGA